jgi:type IV secretion system protein VirB11
MYAKDGKSLQKAGAKELLESALRMRPDRILLQELRDGTAFFYLRNVNSGHPGSITTVHANTPRARSNSSPPRQGIRGRQRSRPP